ncbi:MAG: ATP-binding protein [Rhodospirillales bacterium]|nr:ATP-binding protein [Rhodospirillales bacterium]
MDQTFHLKIKACLETLAEIRDFVGDAALGLGLETAAVSDLKVAVDEAVTNVVIHGYQGKSGGLEINVEREGDDLIVRISDDAPSFSPENVPPPDLTAPLESREIGGMGLHLMRTLTDALSYRPLPSGGNQLTLVKKITN